MTARQRLFVVTVVVLALTAGGRAQNPVLAPPSGRSTNLPVVIIPDGKASIAGRAVEAGSSRGVSGAEVVVTAPRLKAYRFVTTDSDGNFAVGELPAGSYELSISKDGWLPGSFGRTRPSGSSRQITITAEEKRTGVVVPMWRPATIVGSVRDERNEPLAGVKLQVFNRGFVTGTAWLNRGSTTVTDERGLYRLSGLAPGDYVVGIQMPPRDGLIEKTAGLGYQPLYFPDATATSQALVITVGSGEERPGVDFTARTVPVFAVSGVVTPASMVTTTDTIISLVPATGGDAVDMPLQVAPQADGHFRFARVPPGDYDLRIVANLNPNKAMPGLPGPSAWTELRITVNDQPVTDLKPVLQRGVNVSGSLQFKGTAAVPPLDRTPYLAVSLTPAEATSKMQFGIAVVDERGRFSMTGVVPGRYVLEMAGTAGLAGWSLASALCRGVDITDEPLDIADDVSDIVVTFTDQPTRVSGRVAVPGGSSADALVMAFPVDEGARFGRGGNPRRIRNVRTSSDGRYNLVNLPVGAYFVAAVASQESTDEWLDPEYLRKLSAVATRVEVHAGERINRDLLTTHVH